MKDFKAVNLVKSYGIKKLFDGISFYIREGEHVGLIGQNGTGKSSLLEIIAGRDMPDEGFLEYPNDFRIGFLSQEPQFGEEATVFDAVYAGDAPQVRAVKRFEKAVENLGRDSINERYQQEYQAAEQAMNAEDAWQTEVQIKNILTRLGIGDFDRKVSLLSGGQRKRVGLAQVLIQQPDLLLLDEPTNHLDMASITWLEQYLAAYKGSVLLVTHDRYFLENAVTRMMELKKGELEIYQGNYEAYLEQKSEREAIQQKTDEKKLKLYKSELQWMRKGAKARTTKQQARINRFENLKEETQHTGREETLEIALEGSRLGKRVLNLEHISLSAGENPVLQDFSLIIQTQDRIGLVGENGTGKTTLLNMLAGEKAPDSGQLIVGETVRIGYYRQLSETLPEDKRVISYLQEIAEEVRKKDGETVSVTEMLETFLFSKERHGSLISSLSGGEKRRLYLLRLLMTKPNVLLLDEPTNDLDIDTLTVLEDYLQTFNGAVLTVSHDRYFLDKVAEKLVILEQGHPVPEIFYGDMTEYLALKKQRDTKSPAEKTAAYPVPRTAAAESENKTKTKLTYMEQREWETIENDLMELEEQGDRLKAEMMAHATDFARLGELQAELDENESKLAAMWERYEYLGQYAE